MLLLDFSAIAISTVFASAKHDLCEALLRHQILNNLRMYNVKYRAKFGKMIICCDGNSWRKDYYPEYKASRKKNREKSDLDWTEIFRIINKVKDEIKEFMPYAVVQVTNAEADDIIATLVETTQEFGAGEDVLIISADQDFLQLQKYSNVYQYSPTTKKLLVEKNPQKFLMEKVCRGCTGDGVPNILSDDDTFVNPDKRQPPIRANKIEEWFGSYKNGTMESALSSEHFKNYKRNEKCIDLSQIPEEIIEKIMMEYNNAPVVGNSKVFSYLIANQCQNLIEVCDDFFQK